MLKVGKMIYTLPDGRQVDLSKVESISKIRDYGQVDNIVQKYLIGFSIRLTNKEIIEVKDIYHYSDWSEVKLRMNKLREDIINQWKSMQ